MTASPRRTTQEPSNVTQPVRKAALYSLAAFVVLACALIFSQVDALKFAFGEWGKNPALINLLIYFPLLAVALFAALAKLRFNSPRGSLPGLLALLVGLSLLLALHHTVSRSFLLYAVALVLVALSWAVFGWRGLRSIFLPIASLIPLVPAPSFIHEDLFHLYTETLVNAAAFWLQLMHVSVYVTGSILDLGDHKLQIVSTAAELHDLYLYVGIVLLLVSLFRMNIWTRIVTLASSVPIFLLIHSLTIAWIAKGVEAHGFQGQWSSLLDGRLITQISLLTLILEILLLNLFNRNVRFTQSLDLGLSVPSVPQEPTSPRKPVVPALALSALFVGMPLIYMAQPKQAVIPNRTSYARFPDNLGGWSGTRQELPPIYRNLLNLDDYLLANYVDPEGRQVNLYLTYHRSQNLDTSVHSPRSSVPGGGWIIVDDDSVASAAALIQDTHRANTFLLEQSGDDTVRMLVSYWYLFQGQTVLNDREAVWSLANGQLLSGRTDGGLIRVSTMVRPGESLDAAARRLQSFLKTVVPLLPRYIPD